MNGQDHYVVYEMTTTHTAPGVEKMGLLLYHSNCNAQEFIEGASLNKPGISSIQ